MPCAANTSRTICVIQTAQDFVDLPKHAKLLDIIVSPNSSISTLGSEIFSNNFTSIKSLSLQAEGISSIDEGAFQSLSNLTRLTILKDETLSNGRLSIAPGTFYTLPSLRSLTIVGSVLEGITSGVFKGLDNLKFLQINDSIINHGSPGLFTGLPSLTQLVLDRFVIHQINSRSFEGLHNLTFLRITHSNISCIAPASFSSLYSLTNLNLDHLDLPILTSGTFEGLHTLVHLNIHHSGVKCIHPGAFSPLPSLEFLSLDHNQISFLTNETFHGPTDIFSLSLQNNEISHIASGTFSTKLSLSYLYLGYNSINSITTDLFEGLDNLLSLDLMNNNISCLEQGSFSSLSSLKYLYLQNNYLHFIPEHTFPAYNQMRSIDLSFNNLSCLHENVFRNTFTKQSSQGLSLHEQSSQGLSLHGNLWTCDCHLRWLFLFASDNPLLNSSKDVYGETFCQSPAHLKGLSFNEFKFIPMNCSLSLGIENDRCTGATDSQSSQPADYRGNISELSYKCIGSEYALPNIPSSPRPASEELYVECLLLTTRCSVPMPSFSGDVVQPFTAIIVASSTFPILFIFAILVTVLVMRYKHPKQYHKRMDSLGMYSNEQTPSPQEDMSDLEFCFSSHLCQIDMSDDTHKGSWLHSDQCQKMLRNDV